MGGASIREPDFQVTVVYGVRALGATIHQSSPSTNDTKRERGIVADGRHGGELVPDPLDRREWPFSG